MTKINKDPENFYNHFLETVEKFIPESYFEKHRSESKKFELFENPQFNELLKHSPAIVGVFNNVNMGYEFLSDNFEAITGYSSTLVEGPNGMANVLSTFLPKHAEIYNNQIFPVLFEHFKKHSTNKEIKKFRFTATFQFVKKDKSIVWFMQQLNVIEIDEEGFPLLTLLFMSDVTHVKKDTDVDFIVAKKDENNIYQHEYAASFSSLEQNFSFTKRELEILQLLCKGKSSSEIAQLLFISENTVNTHRQNMLGKSDKKNTAELVTYAINKGFVK